LQGIKTYIDPMTKHVFIPKIFAVFALLGLVSCDDDDEKSNLRPSIDYSALSSTTNYSDQFKDESGNTTVDLSEGNTLYKMFQALNYQSTNAVSTNAAIDAEVLHGMFENTGDNFTDISVNTANSQINVDGETLNASELSLFDHVAASFNTDEAGVVREEFHDLFHEIGDASAHVGQAGSKGVPGKVGSYLVDAKGIELAQVIQKSLIGALQLDYIGNVLLDEGLTADNSAVIEGKNYTALEHNWDKAYGLLTLNQIYLKDATLEARNGFEFGAGSYIWEYNKSNFANIYPAFLKGRAAIVNNDMEELQAQATFIRTEIEKTMANAALGYLAKWKAETGTDTAAEAKRIHAIAEGLGFIYSLRFAKLHNVSTSFSDEVLNGLVDSEFGYWDIDATKINSASDAIKTKFGIL
jgi:hypothetical protein